MAQDPELSDLFIIGGGINGCGIARDAAGRGLSVTLAEMGDLAQATSSASTKLFHGGLRYLEYFELRLVRESLQERETLLRAMPHISWPMRFVLPLHDGMRFESDTPASRLLSTLMPWMKGRRPAWMIRLGLFLYDHLGGRKLLPGTTTLDLRGRPEGAPLKDRFARAFEYSDCWVQDSRLVVLNARDAEARGARILTRTCVVSAERQQGPEGPEWRVETSDAETGATVTHRARMLVNAGGPWVAEILRDRIGATARDSVRLVRGSHIVTRRLYDHDKCYFFQGTDGRIIFAIPYEQDFTLIGTTDMDHPDPSQPAECTLEEQDYLLDFANNYFRQPLSRDDIVWTYSGVRPLHAEGGGSASAATRDYTLRLDRDGAPLLNVFGGKITTYRRLAESALAKVAEVLPEVGDAWTAGAALPGGDFPVGEVAARLRALQERYPFLSEAWAQRLFRAYGTEAAEMLGEARDMSDLGRDFGATLTEREVRWLMEHEYARAAEDVLWRRGKLGLRLTPEEAAALDTWMREAAGQAAP
ncbi:glycerol-3-phosphate dehydrogenase [Aquicoccus sp. SCR17]|nr:glycerol-3-phosphate dehydrogenase [Carideicomes alvinocaridis]